jgi:hypothetical protein
VVSVDIGELALDVSLWSVGRFLFL